MRTSRRTLLKAAVATPAALALPSVGRPSDLFGGEVGAMAADGLPVPDAGLRFAADDLVGYSASWVEAVAETAADVRARLDTGWLPWSAVGADRGHGADDPDRDHSPAVLVPGAIEYECRPRPGTTGLRVHPLAGDIGPVGFAAAAPTVTTPIPGLDIIDRSNWTDEPRKQTWDCVIRSSLFGLGCRSDVGLRHALVHHTVTVNDYAASSVPSLLSGIRRYHVDTRGWDDIAYNFVVDRWGRIWHARDADITEPIVGGHTTGLNAESVGVAVLGDFTDHPAPQAVVDSLSMLIGWKLGIHGVDPMGMNQVRSSGGDYAERGEWVKLHNIAGHRDHQITGCPGNQLYSRVPEIRAAAAELVPVFGYVGPRYHADHVALEGWAIERFSPRQPVTLVVAVDGDPLELSVDLDVVLLGIEEFDLEQYDRDYADAGRNHGFRHAVPIDLDTRSITVTARASDGRTASLMDLRLYATFIDVEPGLWYSEAVYWLRETGLTTGTTPGLFEPKDRMTRAQMATFLWRFMDSPDVERTTPFEDVEPGSWYDEAVRWLYHEGITTGTSPDTFAPEAFVTRGQMATFLWRLCGRIDPTAPNSFEDVVRGSYYERAVAWLHETGITTGISPTAFAPERTVTRAEMAVFLKRLSTTPDAWQVVEPSSFVAV